MGYIAGWTGTGLGLAKTSDAGASWQRILVPTDRITTLRFIDERVGWIAGFVNRPDQIACQQGAPSGTPACKGVVLRTQDGGHSWQTMLEIPTDDVLGDPILQLEAIDGQHAWVLTLDSASCQPTCLANLQRTNDGGRSWTTELHDRIIAIRFASANRGWVAVGDSSGEATEVRSTSDGGATWQTGLRTTDGHPFGLDAASVNTAWVLTRNGAYCTSSNCDRYSLYRTDNGGGSWAFLNNPKSFACSGGHLAGPLFASTTRGWLGLNTGAGGGNVGHGGILMSEDGGKTWRCATTPPQISLISAADPGHLWIAGENTTALWSSDDGGASWHRLDLSPLQ